MVYLIVTLTLNSKMSRITFFKTHIFSEITTKKVTITTDKLLQFKLSKMLLQKNLKKKNYFNIL